MTYPVPGAPELAQRVQVAVRDAGGDAAVEPRRGLDHGAWLVLSLMYPHANIPVAQVSLPRGNLAECLELGAALAPLRDSGTLILGPGSSVHNLRAIDPSGITAPWAHAFEDWLEAAVARDDLAAAVAADAWPPEYRIAHPTVEHFAPLLVARAAAGNAARGERVYAGFEFGNIGMSNYAFGESIDERWRAPSIAVFGA